VKWLRKKPKVSVEGVEIDVQEAEVGTQEVAVGVKRG
jgi:hypothetical protein